MITKKQAKELMDKAYDTYCTVMKESYETEGHFYANNPKTAEAGKRAKEAYDNFDIVRTCFVQFERAEMLEEALDDEVKDYAETIDNLCKECKVESIQDIPKEFKRLKEIEWMYKDLE